MIYLLKEVGNTEIQLAELPEIPTFVHLKSLQILYLHV